MSCLVAIQTDRSFGGIYVRVGKHAHAIPDIKFILLSMFDVDIHLRNPLCLATIYLLMIAAIIVLSVNRIVAF